VERVHAVVGEPARELQALVEIEPSGLAEILGRDADDEGRMWRCAAHRAHRFAH
jgi:hypothetical protein